MTLQDKSKLYEKCVAFVGERIDTAQTALLQAQEASNDDTKSSAGDKFETTREMMQQDISRNKRLLMDAKQNLQVLGSIKGAPTSVIVRNGSLVATSEGFFYISVSAGQLRIDDTTYFAVSALSPIGQQLLGRRIDDQFSFNGKQYFIKEIL